MTALSPVADANAVALVLGTMLGVEPQVVKTTAQDGSAAYVVRYAGADATIAADKLNALVLAWRRSGAAKTGGVRYDLGNIVTPVIWRQYWWVLVLGAFAGAGVHYLVTKKTSNRSRGLA